MKKYLLKIKIESGTTILQEGELYDSLKEAQDSAMHIHNVCSKYSHPNWQIKCYEQDSKNELFCYKKWEKD